MSSWCYAYFRALDRRQVLRDNGVMRYLTPKCLACGQRHACWPCPRQQATEQMEPR